MVILKLLRRASLYTNLSCTEHAQNRLANHNSLMQKLSLHDRGELIKYAIQKKIIEI